MKKPLGLFGRDPMTGFYRNGHCEVGPDDTWNHSAAGSPSSISLPFIPSSQSVASSPATLTGDFLDFTASHGNNLRSVGLIAGCKWCLCAARWKEAAHHAESNSGSENIVPKVHIHAIQERTLEVVSYEDLKEHAAESEAGNSSNVAQSRQGGHGGAIKEMTELVGEGV